MSRRNLRAALAEQTALADHRDQQLDAAHARIAALEAELATTEAVGRALLERNVELAAREPVVVLDMPAVRPSAVLVDVHAGLNRAIAELEGAPA